MNVQARRLGAEQGIRWVRAAIDAVPTAGAPFHRERTLTSAVKRQAAYHQALPDGARRYDGGGQPGAERARRCHVSEGTRLKKSLQRVVSTSENSLLKHFSDEAVFCDLNTEV